MDLAIQMLQNMINIKNYIVISLRRTQIEADIVHIAAPRVTMLGRVARDRKTL